MSPFPSTWSWLDDVAAARALAGARRVLCLDPAGDRALAHALAGAEVVVPPSGPSAHLLAFKQAGGALAWEEHVQVLGLMPFGRRVFLYHRLREALPPASRAFWDGHEGLVREGVLRGGALERRLLGFTRGLRRALPPARLEAALTEGAPLGGRRWWLWSRAWLGAAAAARLSAHPGPDNPYAEWLLTADLRRPEAGRVYLSREGHAALSAARLTIAEPEGVFDGLDLGEGPPPSGWQALAAPGARVLGWGDALAPGAAAPTPPDRSPLAPPLWLARLPEAA